MANKRMFTMQIVDSDAFLEMPLSTQCLYFHLNMRADDDGFINNPKKILRVVGCSEDDLKVLIAKRFLLVFESRVIVIKHWRMHNTIQADRYHPTCYQEEYKQLVENENKSYSGNTMETTWKQLGNKVETRCVQNGNADIDIDLDIGIDKDLDKNNKRKTNRFLKPIFEEVVSYINEKQLNVDAENWYSYYESNGWMVGRNHMKDWKACLRQWNSRNKPKEKTFTSDEMHVEASNVADIRNAMFKKG